MRPGARLGVDVGEARVGVARSDPQAVLATPLETVDRRADGSDVTRIAQLAQEAEAVEIVVGLPLSLRGTEGQAAEAARAYAARLAAAVRPTAVRLIDERLSTVDAHRALSASGRAVKNHRAVVDQVAAVFILQAALDLERDTGRPPGEPLRARKPRHSTGARR